MDPNATLAEIRALIADAENDPGAADVLLPDLAEKVAALDEWISKGGYLPRAWWRPGYPGTRA